MRTIGKFEYFIFQITTLHDYDYYIDTPSWIVIGTLLNNSVIWDQKILAVKLRTEHSTRN